MSIRSSYLLQHIPTIGCCFFLLLIAIASANYPGGTQIDTSTRGYSWEQNYLCDVVGDTAYNDQPHQYHTLGLAAMVCLCGSIAMFFFFFTDWMEVTHYWKLIIRWMGLVSMICAMLIFTDLHNIMIAISTILALPALVGVFKVLYHKREMKFIWIGVFIAFLLFMNNFIYYTNIWLEILPQLQKITCLIVITWLITMNLNFVQKHARV